MKQQKRQREFSATELADFFEQLSMLLKSGIPIWEGLSMMAENTRDADAAGLFQTLSEEASSGHSLSAGLEKSGRFPAYAVKMVQAGEKTGRLEETTEALRAYYEGRDALAQSIRASVTYPLCMAAMVLVVIVVLIVQVMPVFEQVFTQLGLAMNPFSLSLLQFGEALNRYAFAILIVVAALIVAFLILRATARGKEALRRFYDAFVFTRRLAQAEAANRFAFSMSLMLESGIDTASAIDFAEGLLESGKARAKIDRLRTLLKEGKPFGEAVCDCGIFSDAYRGIVAAGARSGAAADMLMTVALRYQRETEQRTQRLLAVLEPTLVAVLCVMVGMVMLSVMLPLTGILSSL